MSECMCSTRRPFRRHQSCCHAVDHKSGVTAVSVCTIHLWQMCQLAEHSRGNCYGAGRRRERGGASARERGKRGSNRGHDQQHVNPARPRVLDGPGRENKGLLCSGISSAQWRCPLNNSPLLSQHKKLQTIGINDATKLSHEVVSLVPQRREEDSWACLRPWLEVKETWERMAAVPAPPQLLMLLRTKGWVGH